MLVDVLGEDPIFEPPEGLEAASGALPGVFPGVFPGLESDLAAEA